MYFGTSIGIAVQGNDLDIVCVRGRLNSVAITGATRIEDFAGRPAAEVAQQYQRFRRENHALATSAIVALPRGMGLLRLLELPAEVAPNLAQAVTYQVDSLHPFEEGSVYYDYAALPDKGAVPPSGASSDASSTSARLRVAVGLAKKDDLDLLYQRLCQAGIDVAGFTFSAAALYQALLKPSRPTVLLSFNGSLEILGIAPNGAFYSKEIPAGAPIERELDFCAAELRLKPEEQPVVVRAGNPGSPGEEPHWLSLDSAPDLLAVQPSVRAADFRLSRHFTAFAAALAGAERLLPGLPAKPGLRWNLLPPEKRIYRSNWSHTVAYALAALCALVGIGWVATGMIQDRLYSSWLDAQLLALAPRVERLERLDARQKELLARLEVLQAQQQDIGRKLDAWKELTRLVPPPGWLQLLQFNDSQVTAQGMAESASGILQQLSQSPLFQQPEFASAISRNSEGKEVFNLRVKMRELPVVAQPVAAISPSAAPQAPPAAQPQSPQPLPPAPPAAKGGQ